MCETTNDVNVLADFLDESDEDTTRLKCGEVLFVNNQDICFRCIYCGREITNVKTFLHHIFEYHLISPGKFTVDLPAEESLKENVIKCEEEENVTAEEFTLDVELQKNEFCDRYIDGINTDDIFDIESISKESSDSSIIGEEKWPLIQKKSVIKNKQTEEKTHICEYCAAKFRDRSNLSEHIKRHLGIKPHKCTICGKSFTSSPELRMHMRSHTGEKPYECSECDKKYAHPYRLLTHRRRHKNERPYKCKICDKSFFENKRLRDHEVAHRIERPFSCDTCGSTFKRKNDLKTHSKIHLDVKSYACRFCNKSYAQYAGLYSHMKQHQTSKQIS